MFAYFLKHSVTLLLVFLFCKFRDVVEVLLDSEYWKKLLDNMCILKGVVVTPLRELIRQMPGSFLLFVGDRRGNESCWQFTTSTYTGEEQSWFEGKWW